jgi:hypothetical protein
MLDLTSKSIDPTLLLGSLSLTPTNTTPQIGATTATQLPTFNVEKVPDGSLMAAIALP